MEIRYSACALLTALALAVLAPGAGAANRLFMDVHHLGTVSPEDVAAAHEKDLAVQEKHGVNFIRYWVDQENGTVYCLSEAPDESAVLDTHREAHGLVSDAIGPVTQGQ